MYEERPDQTQHKIVNMKPTFLTATLLGAATLVSMPSLAGEALDKITQNNEIRIGVTGDYMPFSEKLSDGSYVGIEHELAAIIADELGVKLTLVPTSWPTLMEDFKAGKYDLGMSGISVNAARQEYADFSSSYYSYGKSPITLCEHVDQYNTLEKIDQPSTTVVINEGGTNAQFARAHLTKAKLHVEPTNKYVYDRILDGTVDLMITDSVEADYRARHHEELCRSMPDQQFTESTIAAMMPKDIELKARINTILAGLEENGQLDKIIDKNMGIKL
ncbi:putative cyclohexadienyl dehydratase precursor [Photobacterium gaetbulicola Gung47]|uniref:Putative cyclohexadienyl dehydratase n=2 Tax=Photobacterium gaetbulicola TaxID=1295392 RepID=A0A0C5WSS7_9GAMM|nr:putative cyclohexadienyl dehydratase precursor [Photobacterium gaetbulicola Gung47]